MIRLAVATMVFVSFAGAQDVPPPPKPDAVDPSLAPVLESLKQTLLSSGRVEYSGTRGTTNYRTWEQITSVVVDARGCQSKVHYDFSFNGNDPIDGVATAFFESIDTVEALTQQEDHDRSMARMGRPRSVTFSGTVYALAINGNTGSLRFASEAQANKAAEAVRRAAQICRAAPATLNAAAGAPTLADTLHFIEEKLNDNGAVNFREIEEKSDGSPSGKPASISARTTQAAADPSGCLIRFNSRWSRDGVVYVDRREVISFRRVEKLEVGTEQDSINHARAQRSSTANIYKTEPVVYRLSWGGGYYLCFRDEEIANRIAKAMNHAVELCGGGRKDPF